VHTRKYAVGDHERAVYHLGYSDIVQVEMLTVITKPGEFVFCLGRLLTPNLVVMHSIVSY